VSDDATAIARCLDGEADAFRWIVHRYQREALAHAAALLRRTEDARDAVQEAFVDAYRSLSSFDCSRRFYPWFYVILRNRCLKLLRRRGHTATESGSLLARPAEGSLEETAAIEHALGRLVPEDREILLLKYVDGRTHEELAELLGIPPGTAMSRLHRARDRFREITDGRKTAKEESES
jgi:RNA polymerase sigma-70 factor (ECF subfamily)